MDITIESGILFGMLILIVSLHIITGVTYYILKKRKETTEIKINPYKSKCSKIKAKTKEFNKVNIGKSGDKHEKISTFTSCYKSDPPYTISSNQSKESELSQSTKVEIDKLMQHLDENKKTVPKKSVPKRSILSDSIKRIQAFVHNINEREMADASNDGKNRLKGQMGLSLKSFNSLPDSHSVYHTSCSNVNSKVSLDDIDNDANEYISTATTPESELTSPQLSSILANWSGLQGSPLLYQMIEGDAWDIESSGTSPDDESESSEDSLDDPVIGIEERKGEVFDDALALAGAVGDFQVNECTTQNQLKDLVKDNSS